MLCVTNNKEQGSTSTSSYLIPLQYEETPKRTGYSDDEHFYNLTQRLDELDRGVEGAGK